MPGRYAATCSQCAYERTLRVPPSAYAFPDGSTLPIQEGFAWCETCSDVEPCEALPDKTDVRRLLDAANGDDDRSTAAELTRVSDWLEARISPPRCMNCGTVHIRQFQPCWSVYRDDESEDDFLDIPHPGCDGMLHVEVSGWPLYRGAATMYSPEGERLTAPAAPTFD